MGKIAEIFKAHLDNKDIKYTYYAPDENRNEAIKVAFSGDNAESISILFFFDKKDDGDTTSINIKSFSIAKVPTDKLMNLYVALNELNAEYRWVKFYIDKDNEVTVSGDAITDEESAADELEEILLRYINIIDEVYPRIMKALWA